jgi:succinate dehydrogenase/fumarate reductase flavoprotein subunit/ferredoxin-NADP reductase
MLNVIEKEFDVVVIGSGGAGGAAASEAARKGARVLVVSKDPLVCSDSKISEGIITVRESGTDTDTESSLTTNMRVEGSDIGDPELVQTFAEDSIGAYDWLQSWGQKANLSADASKRVHVALGGHNKARSVIHPQGGLDYGHSIWNALLQSENRITFLEDAWCLDVLTGENIASAANPSEHPSPSRRVLGCLIYHAASGELWSVRAPSVILACGGLSTLYFPHTDTMRGNTGDGYAIAARLGCELVDMEQVQFIPFSLVGPKSFEGLVVGEPASAGPLGVLRDRDGEILMTGVMRRNRAEVSAAIALAVQDGRGTDNGGCYLDLTRNVEGSAGKLYYQMFSTVGHAFVKVVKNAQGPKAASLEEPWEIRPSAHYCMGGVRVDADAQSVGRGAVHGLLAAGQVLGGLHGGNRLGSTSLAEGVIFGLRAGSKAAELAEDARVDLQVDAQEWRRESRRLQQGYQKLLGQQEAGQKEVITASALTQRVQNTARQYLGPVRSEGGLREGLVELANIRQQLSCVSLASDGHWNQSLIDYVELVNLLDTAEMIATSALLRKASVGAHVRLDSPRRQILNRRPYSIAIRQDINSQQGSGNIDWVTQLLQRTPTPLLSYLAHKASKQIALLGLAWMYRQSQQRLDPILTKLYRKNADEMGVQLVEADQSSTDNDSTRVLRLKQRIVQTADAVTFCFQPESGESIDFLPGQFGNFSFNIDGEEVSRSYSFSSSPTRKETLDITIKREPGGLVSNWAIDNLREGQTVRMKGPQGKFCVPAHGASRAPKKLLLIGAGSGITPLMSILNWITDSEADVDVILINSVRTNCDTIFADDIVGLDQQHSNLRTYITYTGKQELGDEIKKDNVGQGRLNTEQTLKWVPDIAERHVYVCGPSAFMESVQQITKELGVPKRKLHLENFNAQIDFSAFTDSGSHKIDFTRSNVTAESVPGASLLDLAELQNLDTNFSCRSGTCGECKTRLISGQVHMVCEDGLDSKDKLSGHILTCSAVPLSDCELEV